MSIRVRNGFIDNNQIVSLETNLNKTGSIAELKRVKFCGLNTQPKQK